jgi:hypothetical protein
MADASRPLDSQPAELPNPRFFSTPRLGNGNWATDHSSGKTRFGGIPVAAQAATMSTFTLIHVATSLVGILSGFVVALGMMGSKPCPGWTAVFLWTTLATTVTGFMFPFNGFTPALGTGIVSLLVLAPTFYALNAKKLAGAWRWIYVVGALLAFYLNFFVLIVQSFLKIPALHALAPTQQEPPFALAQGAALLFFIVLGVLAVRKFHPEPRERTGGDRRGQSGFSQRSTE